MSKTNSHKKVKENRYQAHARCAKSIRKNCENKLYHKTENSIGNEPNIKNGI